MLLFIAISLKCKIALLPMYIAGGDKTELVNMICKSIFLLSIFSEVFDLVVNEHISHFYVRVAEKRRNHSSSINAQMISDQVTKRINIKFRNL